MLLRFLFSWLSWFLYGCHQFKLSWFSSCQHDCHHPWIIVIRPAWLWSCRPWCYHAGMVSIMSALLWSASMVVTMLSWLSSWWYCCHHAGIVVIMSKKNELSLRLFTCTNFISVLIMVVFLSILRCCGVLILYILFLLIVSWLSWLSSWNNSFHCQEGYLPICMSVTNLIMAVYFSFLSFSGYLQN